MEAWVIKRDDGKYFSVASHNYERYWGDVLYCHKFMNREYADQFFNQEKEIANPFFDNTRVVKIRIEEVE